MRINQKKSPDSIKHLLPAALQNIIDLYLTWGDPQPRGNGKPSSTHWRRRRSKFFLRPASG